MNNDCRGWRRPIGCLKLQVIFHQRATNSRALLREMTYKDKASYDSTPPCSAVEQWDLVENRYCGTCVEYCGGTAILWRIAIAVHAWNIVDVPQYCG